MMNLCLSAVLLKAAVRPADRRPIAGQLGVGEPTAGQIVRDVGEVPTTKDAHFEHLLWGELRGEKYVAHICYMGLKGDVSPTH